MNARHEMLELIVVDGRARGIVVRDLVTGEITTDFADAVVLASGGYGNVFFLSTNAKGCNVTATWRAHRKGALFANPCYTQIHPTCIPVSGDHQSKLTLMSESLRNDGRVWVPGRAGDDRERRATSRRTSATTTWSGSTRRSATWSPATSPPAPPRTSATRAAASAPAGSASTSTSPTRSTGWAATAVEAKYGNLFEMYERITGEDPYAVPMRIYPAVHYTMGGLWVDYDLQSTIPGLFVIGEANFSDHGANRLGASALMQGLADGYFVLPTTIDDYLAAGPVRRRSPTTTRRSPRPARRSTDRIERLLAIDGDRTVDSFHRELGQIMWEYCGMERTEEGLPRRSARSAALREEFWTRVKVPGTGEELNQNLEKAGRVADFFELAELMCIDALHRARVVRRPLPRREPDPRRRGAARRRRVQLRRRLGVRPGDARCCTRNTWTSSTSTRARGATSNGHPVRVWRQQGPADHGPDGHLRRQGHLPRLSFLEMLDVLNEQLILDGDDPVAFDHDCREGICGMCGMMINGVRARPRTRHHHLPAAHAPLQRRRRRSTSSRGGPRPSRWSRTWSSTAAPSTRSSRPAATSPRPPAPPPTPTPPRCPKADADAAFEAATCIGCGACVAACPNGSAMLFTAAKVTHLGLLPQGQPERDTRVIDMVEAHDDGRLRRLHQHRRVHGGLPEGHPADADRPPQHRLPQEPQEEEITPCHGGWVVRTAAPAADRAGAHLRWPWPCQHRAHSPSPSTPTPTPPPRALPAP